MRRREQLVALPELFLGLLSIGAAVVLTALSVTGSSRKPISSDLVRWSLTVSDDASSAAVAARHLRTESAAVRSFLRRAGISAASISPAVVTSEAIVEQ